MAINIGDRIYASTLNSINSSIEKVYEEPHSSWGWVYNNYYFYSNKPKDSVLVKYTSIRSAGNEHEVRLYRYENGSWVQKDYDHNGWGGIKENYKGAGAGSYRCYLKHHNNTPTTKILPVKSDNAVGNYLRMMDNGPVGLTEAEAKTINPYCHGVIHASDINLGRVYTN